VPTGALIDSHCAFVKKEIASLEKLDVLIETEDELIFYIKARTDMTNLANLLCEDADNLKETRTVLEVMMRFGLRSYRESYCTTPERTELFREVTRGMTFMVMDKKVKGFRYVRD